nr:proprotein convertase subtilisin:kexin type 5 [Hymenolepis microstoma]
MRTADENWSEYQLCIPCLPLCTSCSSPSRCTSCNEGYTLNKTNGKCETQHSCPQMTYFDENNKQCLPCHSSCARCRGPNPTDCLECHRIVDSNLNPSPACLSIPQFPRFMQSDGAFEFDTFSGPCIPCCHAGRLLEVESPKYCFFCLLW